MTAFSALIGAFNFASAEQQAIAGVRTMEDLMELAVGQRRWLAPLSGSFAGVALLFTLIGLGRVIAYLVA